MVVSGGILRDGSLCMDLVIMDLASLTFIKSVNHTIVIMHALLMLQHSFACNFVGGPRHDCLLHKPAASCLCSPPLAEFHLSMS